LQTSRTKVLKGASIKSSLLHHHPTKRRAEKISGGAEKIDQVGTAIVETTCFVIKSEGHLRITTRDLEKIEKTVKMGVIDRIADDKAGINRGAGIGPIRDDYGVCVPSNPSLAFEEHDIVSGG
jgi:hypothetical protein